MKSRGYALFAALVFAASCSNAKTYEMRGQILGVNRDKMEILVKHEDIPGLMPAMTMPWKGSGPLVERVTTQPLRPACN